MRFRFWQRIHEPLHAPKHLVEPEWLRDAISQVHGACGLNRIVTPGHADDGNRREVRIMELRRTKRVPVHYRHRKIEQDQIGPGPSGHLEGIGAVHCGHHNMPLGAQGHLEKRTGVRVVIDDKYIGHDVMTPTVQEIHHWNPCEFLRHFSR
jgi:hypothetical protein